MQILTLPTVAKESEILSRPGAFLPFSFCYQKWICICRSAEGDFREISQSLYQSHGQILGQTTAMTLRILHEELHFHNKSSFTLKCTPRQRDAAISLYWVTMQGSSRSEANLLHALHGFFASLLESGYPSANIITNPTEQVLFLVSIHPNGGYSADAITKACTSLQYCFGCILIHVARQMISNQEAFTWFERSS